MNLFSKQKLLNIVGSAKKYWWLFVPVLLLLMLGYFVFSIGDALQILGLHIRNFFLTIFMLIRKGLHGIAMFFANMASSIARSASSRRTKMSQAMKRMSENAATARNQLLNTAVDYCTDKMKHRQDKKQRLNEIAKEIKNNTAINKLAEETPTL